MMGMARKVMMSAQRLETDAELKRLKARIEGRVVRDSARRSPPA
jgi:hypothetical protein